MFQLLKFLNRHSYTKGLQKTLCQVALLLAPLVSSSTVHAGTWSISKEGQGSKYASSSSDPLYTGSWMYRPPGIPSSHPGFLNPATMAGASTYNSATAWTGGKITLVCVWQPSSATDLVPSTLTLKITPEAIATSNHLHNDAPELTVSNGQGDAAVRTDVPASNSPNHTESRLVSRGTWIRPIKTLGQSTVRVTLDHLYASSVTNVSGSSTVNVVVDAQLDPRRRRFYVHPEGPFDVTVDEPEYKEAHAYASIGWWDDGVFEHPLIPFYQAKSNFAFFADRGSDAPADQINLQDYKWSVSPETFIPQNVAEDSAEYDNVAVSPSTSTKVFHWKLGSDADALPKSTTTTVVAKDPSDGAQFQATGKINWHWAFKDAGAAHGSHNTLTQLPGGLVDALVQGPYGGTPTVVQKPIEDIQIGDYISVPGKPLRRRVIAKTTNPDGSIALTYDIDPDDNPLDEAYDLNQQILRLQDANTEAIQTGATYVKYGLQGYTELANQAMNPMYNLGTGVLLALGNKAVTLIANAQRAQALAARLRQLYEHTQPVLTQLRNKLASLSQGSAEYAQVASKIDEVEEIARRTQAAVNEAEDVAAKSKYLAQEIDEAVKVNQAAQAAKARGEAALDANAVIGVLQEGEEAAVDAALNGRSPVLSIRAAKEALIQNDVAVLREFLSSRGGRIGAAATEEQIANLQKQAQLMGRVLKYKDAAVTGSAINEGLVIITRDEKLFRFLTAAKIPVEKW